MSRLHQFCKTQWLQYYVHFIDEYSRYTWIYFLKESQLFIKPFFNLKHKSNFKHDTKLNCFKVIEEENFMD